MQSTDPHAPYRPPADFERRFGDPGDTSAFNRMYGKLRDIRAYGGGATVTRAEMTANGIDPDTYIRQAVTRYDAEIAHNDKSIELLVGKFKEAGALDRTRSWWWPPTTARSSGSTASARTATRSTTS